MIGFKTTDALSYDECIVFLTEHDRSDSSWDEINQHYLRLLTEMQKEDEFAFKMCSTSLDYKNYLNRFKNIRGASNYQPLHKVEAEDFVQMNHITDPVPHKGFFASYLIDANQRNFITNVILYLLLVASLITAIVQIPGMIRTYQYFVEDGWPFIRVYGKGFMPGFLLSAVAVIGVSAIIKWRKSGLTILMVSFIMILLPTICNEFLEFILFSIPSILGIALLWGILKLKKNGISTWEKCKAEPRWADYVLRVIICLWLFMIILLPPIMGLYTGFRSNIYNNGMRCLDAHFNNNPYYSYKLYQKILLDTDFKDDIYAKKHLAASWWWHAKYLNNLRNEYGHRIDDELSEPVLFINNLLFILNNESNQDALDYIDSMKNQIDLSTVFQYLNGKKYVIGEYDYYMPNKERITSILNQAEIFEEEEIIAADGDSYSHLIDSK